MIRVRFLASFDDALGELTALERKRADRAVKQLLDYFDGGPKPLGLGLRKLRDPYWEVRASLARRIIFSLQDELATFILVGSHDEIGRFLKRR